MANHSGQGVSVRRRHLDVEDDEVEKMSVVDGLVQNGMYSVAVLDWPRLQVRGLEDVFENAEICEVVVDDQYPFAGQADLAEGFGLLLLRFFQRGSEMKDAALTELAFDPNVAAHQAGDFAANGKPQAGAAVFPSGRAVSLAKGLEDGLEFVSGDADARISDAGVEGDGFLVSSSTMRPVRVPLVW